MKKTFQHLFAIIALLGLAACADVPELPYPTPDDDSTEPTVSGSLPFTSNSLNDFTVQTIKGTAWSLGSTYAKASGYTDGTTTATQTWLVSPVISTTMQGTEGIVINFEYVLRYVKSGTDVKGYHRVMASTDYSGDVTTATWTDLGFVPVESATQDWTFYSATPIALPQTLWNEEKVYIALYFECTDANSTTWEVKEFSIAEGKAEQGGGQGDNDDDEPGGNTPEPPADGKYTVAQVIAAGNPATQAWVKGYIVGTVPDKSYTSALFSTESASQTNFLLADDANCTDASLCIPVQLPAGNVRTSLNLKDNPGNLGKFVYLYGSLEKYFGVPGLKSVTEFSFDGEGGGDDSGNTGGGSDPASLPYTADFTKSACDFSAQDIELGSLSYVWAQSATYGWKASAYKNGNQATESWLVSPVIDLTAATAPVMVLYHALNYLNGATATDFLGVCASTDYAGDATKATWTTLTVPTWPSGADWNFVESGDISLAAFAGKKVTIALHYKSTTDTAPTWEVKTLSVK